jgi:hypothetical protein
VDIVNKQVDLRRRLFEKTGCVMSIDGSGDDKINPQGADNFAFVRAAAPAEPMEDKEEKGEIKEEKKADRDAEAEDDDAESDDDELFDEDDEGELDADIHQQTLDEALPDRDRSLIVTDKPAAVNKKLVGRKIVYKFNFGWFLGRVRKIGKKGEFNAEVDYGDGKRPQLLDLALYGVSDDAQLSSWVMLKR